MRITIFFILIFQKNIFCDESNESKYIDLLPEEEKEQFLQKIAKRIFEEAEVTDDRYKLSREVTDDQLNEHTDFVDKILREESANLRKQSRDGKEREENSDDSMRVKPLVKDKISKERVDDGNRYVDLTLRQGRRKKRKDNFSATLGQNTEEKIDVDVKYSTEENKIIENGGKRSNLAEVQSEDNAEELMTKRDQSSFEDIQVKYFSRKHDVDNKKSDEILTSTISSQLIKITDFHAESVENFSKELITAKQASEKIEISEPTPLEGVVNTKIETSSEQFTEPITKNGSEHKSTTEDVTTTTTIKASIIKESSIVNSTDIQEVNDTKRVLRSGVHEILTGNITGDEMYISKEYVEKTSSQRYDYTTQNKYTIKNNTLLIKDSAVNTDYKPKIGDQIKDTTINNTVVLATTHRKNNTDSFKHILDSETSIGTEETTTNIEQTKNILNPENNVNQNESNAEVEENKFGATTIKSEVTNDESAMTEVAGDVVKALRHRLLEDGEELESTEPKSNTEHNKDYVNNNKQIYKVYELPTNQEPFSIKHKMGKYKNREQPHYVPIYNYSPNNAYFNAQNRYGPNVDDVLEEEEDSDTDFHGTDREDDMYLRKEKYGALRDRDDNRKFRFGNKENSKPTHKIRQTMMPTVKQTQHFPEGLINTDDYLDTDYYFGRTNTRFRHGRQDKAKKLPDSDEETHPSLEDTVKDHIRSVRKILFQNQIFGYIPPVNNSARDITPPQKSQTVAQALLYKYLKRNSEKNIAVSFGRMKVDDKYENVRKVTKVGYIKHGKTQDLYLTKDIPEELMKKVNVIKFADQLFFRDDIISIEKIVKSLRNRTKIFSHDESSEYYDTIKKVFKLTNEVDLFTTLEKMRGVNITYTRSRNVSEDLTVYLQVLGDLLNTDIKPFIQYDWLGSTVDIQSALRRLMDMTEAVQNKIVIHPADLGLLKYVAYLFQTSKLMLYMKMERDEINQSRMGVMLPRNRKRKRMFLKEKGLLNRVWLFKRENIIESGVLNEFVTFLSDLQEALFDLHNALKHIALITKYTNQAWFKDLQRIYMKNDKKHLLEVALHLTATRLFGLIEESAKNGVEMNMVGYIRNNEKQVERSIDEFVFVLRLLDEIKYMENYMCFMQYYKITNILNKLRANIPLNEVYKMDKSLDLVHTTVFIVMGQP